MRSKVTTNTPSYQLAQSLRGEWGREGDKVFLGQCTISLSDPNDDRFKEIVPGKLWIMLT